ncbi:MULTISPECIES: glutaminyl-peptide cyclotransferase [Chitinophagaceae]
MKSYVWLVVVTLFLGACNGNNSNTDNTPVTTTSTDIPNIPYQVVNIYPHDTAAYTEGLFFHDGDLYESTGGDKSFIVKRTIQDEKPLKKMDLAKPLFGEGITILNGKLYQLTWTEHKVLVYDTKTWSKIGELSWPHEGWGMTTDGKSLILSTGDSNLYYVNPADFSIEKIVGVTDQYGPKGGINELEYVDGMIYSNVFGTDIILKIDPSSGKIIGTLDMTDINKKNGINYVTGGHDNNDVLNGIAYNPTTKTFFVTGKRWPKIFEIKL